MLGTTAGITSFEGLFQGYRNETSRVQAVVDMYGPIDFLKEDGFYPVSCGTNGYVHEYNSFETVLLAIDSLHKHPAIVQAANPTVYITPDDAHFFIIHGENDCTVPPNQSKILDSMLTSAGIRADTLIIAAGQNHGSPYFSSSATTALYNDFFLKHLSTPCLITGISDIDFQNINVFPNPATNEINFNLPSTDNFNAEIINTFGERVLKTQNQNRLNISELPCGIYFLKLNYANKSYIKKFIKL